MNIHHGGSGSLRWQCVVATVVGVVASTLGVGAAAAAAPDAPVQATLYAAPDGHGDACTKDQPCSLTGARDKVRQLNGDMTGDIDVDLLAGTYAMTGPLTLAENTGTHDSGTNGFDVVYQAAPGAHPVLSGGRRITGWSRVDESRNIWRADVGDLQTRQLYVDGVRAVRDHGPVNPAGFTLTSTGWQAPDDSMASWKNLRDVELMGFYRWKALLCPIDSINGRDITMQQPCWENATRGAFGIHTVTWVQNAYELLGTPGQFYLDRSSQELYYVPRTGEDLTTADVEAPVAQTLVSGVGTRTTPLHDVAFRGIGFQYATWLGPSSAVGFPGAQSGMFALTGGTKPKWSKMPGNVTFSYGRNLRFEGDTFTHLGAAALTLQKSPQHDRIVGNVFADVSNNGIQVGESDGATATDPDDQTFDNTISDNVLRNIGAEYPNSAGIWVGYAADTVITHNDLENLAHTGISVGWGWGTDSFARHNVMSYNRIHRIGQVLWDLGGVYTLSAMPDSEIRFNDIDGVGHDEDQVNNGIYLDEGSGYVQAHDNLVRGAHNWLSIWNVSQHDNVVTDNVADRDFAQCPVNQFGPTAACNVGTNVVTDNLLGSEGQQTSAGQGAGLAGGYRDLAVPDIGPMPWAAYGKTLRPATPTPGPEDLAAAGHPNTYHPQGSPRG